MIHFGYFSFFTIHLELKRQIRLYAPVVPLKTIPVQCTIMVKIYIRFQTKNGSKTIPFGTAHTYLAYMGEYPLPPPPPPGTNLQFCCTGVIIL